MVIILYLWYIQNGATKLLLMAEPLKHPQSESGLSPLLRFEPPAIVWAPPPDWIDSVILCPNIRQISWVWLWNGYGVCYNLASSGEPLLHRTTLTTGAIAALQASSTCYIARACSFQCGGLGLQNCLFWKILICLWPSLSDWRGL